MIRRGQLTEAEARYHPNRSVITRALGTDPAMVADTYELTAGPGDRLLLCTDGLTGMLEDAMIAETLVDLRRPQHRCVTRSSTPPTTPAATTTSRWSSSTSAAKVPCAAPPSTRAARGAAAAGSPLIGWLLLFALIVGGVVFSAYHVANSRAYLTAENGVVVIYQGVPGSFAGVTLSTPRRGDHRHRRRPRPRAPGAPEGRPADALARRGAEHAVEQLPRDHRREERRRSRHPQPPRPTPSPSTP